MEEHESFEEPRGPIEPSTLLTEVDFCAFDLETTGLSNFSRMVEVGAVRFRLGGEGETFQTLVNPGESMPEVVIEIHGITDEMVEGAPSAPEVIESFLEFSQGCVLVAHNAPFDAGILSTELHRAGIEPPDTLILDTIPLAREFLTDQRSFQLGKVAESLGVAAARHHRALADADTCRRVFEGTVKKVPFWQSVELGRLAQVAGGCTLAYCEEVQPELPSDIEILRRALDTRTDIIVIYEGGSRGRAPRRLSPVAMYSAGGMGYLEARCHADNVTKSFRVDRIASVEPWKD